jgi:hypothetical protein
MDRERKKLWIDLCAEAAICHYADRLQELRGEIVGLLEEEEHRLRESPKKIYVVAA